MTAYLSFDTSQSQRSFYPSTAPIRARLSAYVTVDSRSTLIWSACFIAWAKS